MNLRNKIPKYHTPEQVSELIGVTVGTLATWRMTGRYNLPFIKVGRKVLYRVTDVESWLESRVQLHTGEGKA
ncbi:helix-turn-helix domain-containing protein [Thiomicrorhabdus xiamenensis]|uniref:Helix-turn-helix domain-containing protein n=1 Tax=Thiomicrorhabdus xiamenensis TaxID=2739063 RepID=A0A7D4NQ46_9GAMM|nr:helix-turn-helix domain-containing protein [Thiomicrorhabdus xiamenensis]